MFTATNHQTLLLFTESGKCFWLKVYEIPEGAKTTAGRVIQNLLNIPKEDRVRAYIIVKKLQDEEFINNNYIVFCTKNGQVKKTLLEEYSRPRQGGINAIGINEGDALIEAKLTNGKNEIILAVQRGRPGQRARVVSRRQVDVVLQADHRLLRAMGEARVGDAREPDAFVQWSFGHPFQIVVLRDSHALDHGA